MAEQLKEFGRKVRILRQLHGLSQAELAARLGVSQKIVSAYERSYRNPPAATVMKIAEEFGTTPNELFPDSKTQVSSQMQNLRKQELWKLIERIEDLPESNQEYFFKQANELIDKLKDTGI